MAFLNPEALRLHVAETRSACGLGVLLGQSPQVLHHFHGIRLPRWLLRLLLDQQHRRLGDRHERQDLRLVLFGIADGDLTERAFDFKQRGRAGEKDETVASAISWLILQSRLAVSPSLMR
jgi:hypothetical protein